MKIFSGYQNNDENERFRGDTLHMCNCVCCQHVLGEGVTFNGRMDLSDNADNTFCLLEYYGVPGTPPSSEPYHIYFARWVRSLTGIIMELKCVLWNEVSVPLLQYY